MVIQRLDSSGVVADTTGDCLLRWCHCIRVEYFTASAYLSLSEGSITKLYKNTISRYPQTISFYDMSILVEKIEMA